MQAVASVPLVCLPSIHRLTSPDSRTRRQLLASTSSTSYLAHHEGFQDEGQSGPSQSAIARPAHLNCSVSSLVGRVLQILPPPRARILKQLPMLPLRRLLRRRLQIPPSRCPRRRSPVPLFPTLVITSFRPQMVPRPLPLLLLVSMLLPIPLIADTPTPALLAPPLPL